MQRALFVVALLVGQLDSLLGETPTGYNAPEVGKVRIVRDRFGVPHIIARNNRDMFFGVGFAQAQDQLENLARNYLLSEGRGTEFLGPRHLPLDHFTRSLGLPGLAQEGYARLTPDECEMLTAFADGINAYIEQHRETIPDWIEPAEPHDTLTLGLYVNSMFVMGDCQQDLRRAGIKLAGWEPPADRTQWGSNQFVIEPSRSATGGAMLSADPHLPHRGVLRWYEMHQVGADINAMGATFFGLPFVALGRTADTAWCQTVNAPDLGDVFTLQISKDNPNQYRGPSGWESFEVSKETYLISNPDGTKREVTQRVIRTRFGPVVTVKDGVAYAFRLAIPAPEATVTQAIEVLRANTLAEFRKALAIRGLAMFNFAYADRHGDTFYISNSLVPNRDTRIPSHDLRPAAEAWADWGGIHALDELPQVDNPTCGYLMNTNSGPQNVTETDALDPEDFPPYMMQQQMNSRGRRLQSLLKNNSSITWSEMQAYATDTKVEADEPLARLAKVTSESDDPQVAAAWRVLRAWNHRTDLDSRGAVLFFHLVTDEALVKAMQAIDSEQAIAEMKRAASKVEQSFGSLDVAWREFSLIKRGQHELGIAGCGGMGQLVGAAMRPTYGELVGARRYCGGGSSYGMIVDFSGDTRAVSCLPFGVSEQPDSEHFADMLPIYAQRSFKPAWFLPAEVEANVESEETLTIAN